MTPHDTAGAPRSGRLDAGRRDTCAARPTDAARRTGAASTVAAVALSAALLHAAPAVAQRLHEHVDWLVGCDNTRACVALGMSPETDAQAPAVLRIERDAGAQAAATATVRIFAGDGRAPQRLTVQARGQALGSLARGRPQVLAAADDTIADFPVDAARLAQWLPALAEGDALALRAPDGRAWRVSLAGAKAALLRLDDAQGRVGGPTALLARGTRDAQVVAPPLPEPVLRVPGTPRRLDDARALEQARRAALDEASSGALCERDVIGPDPDDALWALDERTRLLRLECSRAAYNASYAFWLVSARPPLAPRRVVFAAPPGLRQPPVDELTNAGLDEDGVLSSYSKGRGLGDCFVASRWAWTGRGFEPAGWETMPACRGLVDEALVLYRARVLPAVGSAAAMPAMPAMPAAPAAPAPAR